MTIAGCKGAGTAGLDPEPSKPGSVLVTVSGLPNGAAANVTLTGPGGFSRVVSESGTIPDLAPGAYTLSAADMVAEGDGYSVAPASQSVVVRAAQVSLATAAYTIATGRLLLLVEGIPAAAADVLLSGPAGFSRVVTSADTVKGLPNGTYIVRPRSVTVDGDLFGSAVDSLLVLVTPGTNPSPAGVQYQLASGRLDLVLAGVPEGATATVALDGPGGFSLAATGSQTFKGLVPGQYTLHGTVVNSDGDLYEADIVPAAVQVTPSAVPLSAAATYRIKTGSLTIDMSGLPTGVAGNVTVSGPGGFTDHVTADKTIRSLVPGSYTITAADVSTGGSLYQGQPPSQTVSVTAAKQPVVRTVAYSLGVGSLRVNVAGVPGGATAAISVTGPNGFAQSLTGAATLSGLAPGSYTVGAAAISAAGQNYAPAPVTQTVTVAINATTTAAVTYAVTTGSLAITINGLPGGTAASVTVTGPGGFSQGVTAGTTLVGLAPGSYAVAAVAVSAGGQTYTPSPTGQTASVTAGSTAAATINYAGSAGNLAVTVTGLPGGVSGALTVTGPGGFNQALAGTQTLTGLQAGTYTIAAANVSSGGIVYVAGPASQSATVSVGVTTAAGVTYTATGSLTVTITGLPGGNPANVMVTGPGGFTRALTATQSLTGLTAGTYTIAATNVAAGGTTYLGAPASQSATVTAGATTLKSVTYSAAGSLTVTVTGLPGGTNASISVTGPGYSQSVTGTTTLTGLAAGSYPVTAGTVSSGGNSYVPSPSSQTAAVTSGATASATVAYAIGAPVPLNLVIDGMYVTQAAAKYDGTTPIIAGRDAYLRVFVKANQANTVTPTVRVRLYSGASLIQTSTINAPGASVPTTVTEGTLASSWNLLIPAATVQANLRVLADVDPTNVVVESNDADNTFPVSGTPFALDVRTVPTWNVRFVPVLQSANSLQGNVTVGNAATFLIDPLKLLPVAGYSADVRAVYTTTAPALQSGNGNGAWGTILSEVAALRSADASTRYYYGVVKTSYGGGVAGIGYVGGSIKTSLGWDILPSGSGVMAHEVGHNMGRQHSPCGGAGGPDPAYPYAGGIIGTYGLDLTTLTVKSPTTNFDFMGYCSPNWVSDYTWSGLITYRQAGPNNAPPVPSNAVSGLLVWGRIGHDGGVVFEPAFRVAAPATQPATAASGYRVEGLAADGRLLFSQPVELVHTMTINMEHEQHFVAVIPLDQAQDDGLAQLRLVTPVGPVNRLSPQAIVQAGGRLFLRSPGAAATSPNPAQATVTWDAATYPMAMVRDAATGEILSFARGGAATIWTRSRQFDVTFSDGVRSTVRRIARP